MASKRNDALLERTVEGSINYYDGHKGKGTATDKGLAARLGGHNYNIITGSGRDEIYFRNLRNGDHFLDHKGRATSHFMGERRRKFAQDDRNLVGECLRMQEEHPRVDLQAQRRTELQLAQMENHQSWRGFQERQDHLFPPSPAKRYSIHNKKYANEVEKLRPRHTTKDSWLSRRGEPLVRCLSCPSVQLSDPQGSLAHARNTDSRKEVSQRMTESAHFAPWITAHTYANSIDNTPGGRQHDSAQQHCSVHRVENHDFAVSRKNNHFSSQDKLTRADPFYMRPRLAMTNSGVKYDIISNERRWFKY